MERWARVLLCALVVLVSFPAAVPGQAAARGMTASASQAMPDCPCAKRGVVCRCCVRHDGGNEGGCCACCRPQPQAPIAVVTKAVMLPEIPLAAKSAAPAFPSAPISTKLTLNPRKQSAVRPPPPRLA